MYMSETKRVSWDLVELILSIILPSGLKGEFDVSKIFPKFSELSDICQQIVVYGIKQKLSDKVAGFVGTDADKLAKMQVMWSELLEGKWASDRVGFTPEQKFNRAVADYEASTGKKAPEMVLAAFRIAFKFNI